MNAIEVVCAIIQNEHGEVWIGCRKSKVAVGIWEFPGGKVEPNETKEEACIREIKEELSCEIAIDDFLMDLLDEAFTPAVHLYAYLAHIIQGEPQLHAHKEGKWVMPQALYAYAFQDADRPLLDMVHTLHKTQ